MKSSCVQLTRRLIAAYFVLCMVPNAVGNASEAVSGIWSALGQPSQSSPQTSSRDIPPPGNVLSVRITADGVFSARGHRSRRGRGVARVGRGTLESRRSRQ